MNNYASPRRLALPQEDRATSALWVTYRWMTAGLAATGIVALLVASSPAILSVLLGSPILFYGLMFAQLGLVVAFSSMAPRVTSATAALMFFAYAALTGITFSTIFLVYTAGSIARVFFISAGAFAGLSIFGMTTKRDLGVIGRFALFAIIGIIVASIVNIFLQSTGLDWIVSIAGVLVFGGLTAYDTQRLKAMFAQGAVHGNLPLIGALTLYLDFINMFLFLLRIFGRRRA